MPDEPNQPIELNIDNIEVVERLEITDHEIFKRVKEVKEQGSRVEVTIRITR